MVITPILTDAASRRDAVREKAVEGLKAAFPLKLRDQTLELHDVHVVHQSFGPTDQKQAILQGTSLQEPVKGTVVLKDAAGREVERVKNFTLLHLPYMTERHTFIVAGNEYQVANQVRMKPGVYARKRANEELEAAFNLAKGSNFRLSLDPVKGHPLMEYASTTIPLYPVLRQLGVPHQDVARAWGTEVAETNRAAFDKKHEVAVEKLYKKLIHPAKQTHTTHETRLDAVREAYGQTVMDPEVNRDTLGHPHEKVTPLALLDASKKLLSIYKSDADTDDRDSLAFKTFHSVDDFVKERIALDARSLANKVKLRATNKTSIRDILPPAPFTTGIKGFLAGSQLSAIPTQINPMEMIDHSVKVTSLGEGGISSDRAVPLEARQLHHTHLGIFDTSRTPESFNAGIDIRTAMETHRDEKGNLYAILKDRKTGKTGPVTVRTISRSVVAFPGQPKSGMVSVMKDGQVQRVASSEVDFELLTSGQLFSPSTNLVPFIESSQGNRITMGSKMQTQALPLLHREVPLVQAGAKQVLANGDVRHTSFEKLLGKLTVPVAPVSGTVVKVDSQYIYIDPTGKHAAETLVKTAGAVKRQKTINGLTLKIELEKGDERKGVSPEGKAWSKTMALCYGHIPKTTGDDGETVDVYLKEDGAFDTVYVVHQRKKDGSHDEDKCMLGFDSKDSAKEAYQQHGPEWGFGSLTEYSWDEFLDDYIAERRKEAAEKSTLVKVPYDTHFPFASKTSLHHTVMVKPGDHVKADQVLADSNYTREGELALGKNMSVAYLAYYGMNSNDAVVISEGAAKKLTSEHVYKEIIDVDPDTTLGREVHRQYYGSKYTAAQYEKLSALGVVKKGQKVLPHDPLIVGVVKTKLSASDVLLSNLKKSLVKPYKELARLWEHDFEGEVLDVYESEKRVVVVVRTYEPMRVGDKLCYSEDTDMLTRTGWKPVAEVTVDDEVATLNKNGQLEYQTPTATHAFPQGGEMYSLQTQQVDLLVTEGHRMFVKRRGQVDFELLAAKPLLGKRVQYKKNAHWEGVDPKSVVLPGPVVAAGQGGTGARKLEDVEFTPEHYAMLLGMFLSEGNIVDQPASGSYGIDITQVKEPNRTQLLDALTAAGIDFNSHGNGEKVRIYSKTLLEHFKQFGKSHEKFIPREVFTFSRETLETLFKWLMWGDGHTDPSSGLPVSYTTTSPRLADDVQQLCLHTGRAANISHRDPGVVEIKGTPYACRRVYSVRIVTRKVEPQVNHGHSKTQRAQKEALLENYDQPVHCVTVPNHVVYVRRNGKPVWSGNSGRYGNKGVIGQIVPDHKMIQDEKGAPIDVLYTSAGVISRINPAQIIETAVAKVADKTGKPIEVESFSGRDNVAWAKALLKEHGVKDKETVFDPISGKRIPDILVGKQYTFRLFKTTDSNFSARDAGGGYDINQQPTKGGVEGAKGIGNMEFNALVAHNARNFLRESAALKSQKNDEFWRALQLGLPLPAMKTPFAFNKFTSMMQASGVRVDQRGSKISLQPLTDNDVLRMSSGAIQNEKLVRAKDLAPERGGFFDPALTGGDQGTRWTHINLAEPVVNPVFAEPVRRLMGMTNKQFDEAHFKKGGAYFKQQLNDINVESRLKELHADLKKAPASKVDDLVKQIKYLESLKRVNLRPGDAYVLTKLPVIPPVMRPILPGNGGQELVVGDSNLLYQTAMLHNKTLMSQVETKLLPPDEHAKLRENLHNAIGAVIGTNDTDNQKLQKRNVKGFLEHLTGKTTPKCYDAATDILTEHGWVPFPAYDGKAKVATVNLGTHAFEWQAPVHATAEHYSGPMIHTQSREIDLLVTPNHQHVVSVRRKRVDGDVWLPWEKVDSTNFLVSDRKRVMVSAEHWKGQAPALEFDGVEVTALDAFAEFVGWWVSEGWLQHGGAAAILCQAATSPHVATVDACFSRLGIPFIRSVYTRKGGYQAIWWKIKSPALGRWLRENCGEGSKQKFLSQAILSWPAPMLLSVLKGYVLGDGSLHKGKTAASERKTRKRRKALASHFCTTSTRLIDSLQELCAKTGYQAILRKEHPPVNERCQPIFTGSIRGFSDVTIESAAFTREVPFDGLVYCVTVPNGTLVVRRGGKPAVSGNSSFFHQKLLMRKQDLSARGTAAPDGSLGIDDVGLPEDMMWEIFGKFVINRLVRRGFGALQAKEMLEKRHPAARDALLAEAKERPVILNRAPTLHRYGMIGAFATPVTGKTIRVNPAIEKGMNLDFDGDTLQIHTPVLPGAVDDVKRMTISKLVFSDAKPDDLMYGPRMEAALGLYHATAAASGAKTKHFKTKADAVAAYKRGEVKLTDTVEIG